MMCADAGTAAFAPASAFLFERSRAARAGAITRMDGTLGCPVALPYLANPCFAQVSSFDISWLAGMGANAVCTLGLPRQIAHAYTEPTRDIAGHESRCPVFQGQTSCFSDDRVCHATGAASETLSMTTRAQPARNTGCHSHGVRRSLRAVWSSGFGEQPSTDIGFAALGVQNAVQNPSP